ncbi:fimbrial biogenesis chaperone [Leptothrix sp. BB-4]
MKTTRILKAILGLVLAAHSLSGQAAIQLGATRLIYNEASVSESISASNRSEERPSLLQIWMDDGDIKATPEQASTPFHVSPPLANVGPSAKQVIRVSLVDRQTLPQDRESVFWLNVLDIPASSQELDPSNLLRVAVRTRIKVFYRPKALARNDVASSVNELSWEITGKNKDAVVVRNKSPYHITISGLKIAYDKKEYQQSPGSLMVSPRDSATINLNQWTSSALTAPATEPKVRGNLVNDLGGEEAFSISLRK